MLIAIMLAMPEQDAISLTKTLLRFDTINPPGREGDCARYADAPTVVLGPGEAAMAHSVREIIFASPASR
jgi:acetylornithine deacetylase/succinyl-diaminopimelate desuccinylase-like protein